MGRPKDREGALVVAAEGPKLNGPLGAAEEETPNVNEGTEAAEETAGKANVEPAAV